MAYATFTDLLAAADAYGSLGDAAIALEAEEEATTVASVTARLEETLTVMEQSAAEGLVSARRSRSGLTGQEAELVAANAGGLTDATFAKALSWAMAIAEVNAAMGRVVAAPTGGSSGIVPGVLMAVAERVDAPREAVARALATAGAIGGVIASHATLSGAAAGCQAEIGSAAAMAAAAAVELAGGTAEQAGHAASLALQGQMGLVCDPVAGLVEIPCVVRNATGASVALAAAELALAGVAFPIPFDEVAESLGSVGRSLPPSLRETAQGGLAMTPTGRRLAERIRD